ncbi:Uncharacterised protein [Salmonella enterica subsp. enterica serovar Bovismorbificans]|uniref:Uncharacterized protein n=1 Tax=Salmonella enterica subsp. enterica serovar Bovismorbificans TaxID=58097 RepID=A0A655DMW7_SALET|nr:Uncharacterised protein [Salmonella enterica subsp. enterica serovar Bovismorbificans]CNV33138.1 Uncharacterised protein [Salmonella enterica subsp. enterica serovar Bovismorbificans]
MVLLFACHIFGMAQHQRTSLCLVDECLQLPGILRRKFIAYKRPFRVTPQLMEITGASHTSSAMLTVKPYGNVRFRQLL